LPGAHKVELRDVMHGPGINAGQRWYGSPGVLETWAPFLDPAFNVDDAGLARGLDMAGAR
jgi:hypothetical protein